MYFPEFLQKVNEEINKLADESLVRVVVGYLHQTGEVIYESFSYTVYMYYLMMLVTFLCDRLRMFHIRQLQDGVTVQQLRTYSVQQGATVQKNSCRVHSNLL